MKRVIAAMTAALLMVSLVSGAALAAKPGNSLNAKLCQGQGYLTLIGSSGQTFASSSDCTSYAAHGTLYTKPTLATADSSPVVNANGPVLNVTLSGTNWQGGTALVLTYNAWGQDWPGYPLPATTTGTSTGYGTFSTTLPYDNCLNSSGVFVNGDVPYTFTVSDGRYTGSIAGTLHCALLTTLTPTLTSTITGPEAGLGPLTGTLAMRFTLGGTGWISGEAISLTYAADPPLGYTVTDPTLYFTPGLPSGSVTGVLDAFFQDNCFDNNGVLVSGPVHYTITGTNTVGQTASVSGNLNCDLITGPAGLIASTGPAVGNDVYINATGWRFAANTQLTSMLYDVPAFAGGPYELGSYTTLPTTDANGNFTFQWDGDNCIYGTLQTTDQTFTMQVSDGTHTATATGVLKCSLLAP